MRLQAYAHDAYSSTTIKKGGQERSTRKIYAKHGKSSSRQRKRFRKYQSSMQFIHGKQNFQAIPMTSKFSLKMQKDSSIAKHAFCQFLFSQDGRKVQI